MVSGLFASDDPTLGSPRSAVIAKYGEPVGIIQMGTREIMTYARGRVTLENGRVIKTHFVETDVEGDTAAPVVKEGPRATPGARHAVTVVPAGAVTWHNDLDDAQAAASAAGKRMLVLFWSDALEPWATTFERTVVNNAGLLRELDKEFVLARLEYGKATGPGASDAEYRLWKNREAFRERIIGGGTFPALAIVSADTRQWSPVRLDRAMESRHTLTAYVGDAIETAKTQPMLPRPQQSSAWVLVAAAGSAFVALVLFRC
jgi:hypothetical protein